MGYSLGVKNIDFAEYPFHGVLEEINELINKELCLEHKRFAIICSKRFARFVLKDLLLFCKDT